MLTATYTPDSASSSTCYSATGSNSVTVTTPVKTTPTVTAAAKTTPTFTVTAPSSSITTAQALMVTVAVSGNPIPTGSVTLTGGGYTPAATILSGGSAIISVPAGRLYCDRDGHFRHDHGNGHGQYHRAVEPARSTGLTPRPIRCRPCQTRQGLVNLGLRYDERCSLGFAAVKNARMLPG